MLLVPPLYQFRHSLFVSLYSYLDTLRYDNLKNLNNLEFLSPILHSLRYSASLTRKGIEVRVNELDQNLNAH